ncbi:GDSL-type esterase/lipase family protein [Bombilactobacillus folatiphilus]|uniref:GDSL-type esterase/lipase family protein n=1 Tax=Bombilactobacillus folatiphilus TaxID=2923362 RepID=A0ABY4P9E1_9LACO|nr:GDSL-type esterase/lipase family protein [Bombilactobacillus folatiphilus]UQS82292.1 GDSL-type esterase/lipase family protein [Bombilactobacillus folatiphilus]
MQRIVLFGDDTLGGVANNQVTDAITKRVATAFPQTQVINRSIPGHKTSDALTHVNRDVVKLNPAAVVLGFGVNDVSVHDEIKPGIFTSNLHKLMQLIGPYKVILLSPPYTDAQKQPNHNWPRQLQLTLAAEYVAQQLNVPFINLLKKMQHSHYAAKAYLQADGRNLNELGWDLLMSLIKPLLTQLLKK